jgi:hypothetical protein
MLASTCTGRERWYGVITVTVVLLLAFSVWAGLRAIDRDACLISDEAAEPYIGMTVLEAEAEAAKEGYDIRVVGRDGECFDRTADLRDDRINVLVENSRVVRAAAF